jgi:nitrogen fixation/metabolism regulation signal transduction histidine kinase
VSPLPRAVGRAVEQLNREVAQIGHESVLMRQEMAGLQKAVEKATEVKSQRRKYIETVGPLQ